MYFSSGNLLSLLHTIYVEGFFYENIISMGIICFKVLLNAVVYQ